MLIVKEFQDTVKEGKFQKKQIISALMKKYGMSQSGIEHIIYATVSNKEKFVPVAEQVSVNINGLVAMGYVIAA